MDWRVPRPGSDSRVSCRGESRTRVIDEDRPMSRVSVISHHNAATTAVLLLLPSLLLGYVRYSGDLDRLRKIDWGRRWFWTRMRGHRRVVLYLGHGRV